MQRAGSGPAPRWRDARLVIPAEFDWVFKDNERARTDTLLVLGRPNDLGYARLGMVITKRLLPRAVDRNRVRRCIREIFRLHRAEFPACDFVVRLLAKPEAGEEIRNLAGAFKRAGQRAMTKRFQAQTSTITDSKLPHG